MFCRFRHRVHYQGSKGSRKNNSTFCCRSQAQWYHNQPTAIVRWAWDRQPCGARRLASARPALAPKCQLILARTLRNLPGQECMPRAPSKLRSPNFSDAFYCKGGGSQACRAGLRRAPRRTVKYACRASAARHVSTLVCAASPQNLFRKYGSSPMSL